MNEKVFESIFVKIEWKYDTITCGTIYRSLMTDSTSNQQFITNLGSVLSHLKPNTKCFIYGDFNYNLLQAENRYTSKIIETMFDDCFYSLINKPTRITNSSATVLDHVWTNIYSQVIKAKILLHPISDHLPLFAISCALTITKLLKGAWLSIQGTHSPNISELEHLQVLMTNQLRFQLLSMHSKSVDCGQLIHKYLKNISALPALIQTCNKILKVMT